jgi:NAD(P)-dependent dehydrogenase (short-subunit alcohol dehydrogenase family)
MRPRKRDVRTLIEQIVAGWGRLDVAINNVGNMGAADRLGVRVHDSTLEAFDSTLSVSLRTTFLCMKYEIGQVLQQGGGAIANTTSLAGVRITPHSSPGYVAAKAAVVHLTRYAAALYAKDNIRVNVVAPGLTATPAVLAVPDRGGTRRHCARISSHGPVDAPRRTRRGVSLGVLGPGLGRHRAHHPGGRWMDGPIARRHHPSP